MLNLPDFLTPLERSVLSVLITGAEFFEADLSSQIMLSRLDRRENNGYGFFTHFIPSETAPILPWQDYRLHATGKVSGQLCGFMLWIKAGRVDFLEGYPLGGDAWPDKEEISELKLN